MSDDGFATVIPLPTASPKARNENEDARDLDAMGATRKRYDPAAKTCWHNRHAAQVDPENRRVYCGGCGVEIDAFEVLSRLAFDNDNLIATRRNLRRDIIALSDRVAALQRDERNTKARLRNARKRLAS